VRCSLHELVVGGMDSATFMARAHRDDGPFRDHLRRMLTVLRADPELAGALAAMLGDGRTPSGEEFYRLRAAGVSAGGDPPAARLRWSLYEAFLRRHLR